MKITSLIISVIGAIAVGAYAQTITDPPELTQLREGWQRATRQATAPLDKRYRDSLTALKLRFTREGKLNEALAIDAELKELDEAQGDAELTTSRKLQIVSAFYGEVGGNRKVEITEVLRRALENREEGIKLNTKIGAEGKDPAVAALKQTTITYRYRGETKTVTFPEAYDLKFKEDLK